MLLNKPLFCASFDKGVNVASIGSSASGVGDSAKEDLIMIVEGIEVYYMFYPISSFILFQTSVIASDTHLLPLIFFVIFKGSIENVLLHEPQPVTSSVIVAESSPHVSLQE